MKYDKLPQILDAYMICVIICDSEDICEDKVFGIENDYCLENNAGPISLGPAFRPKTYCGTI